MYETDGAARLSCEDGRKRPWRALLNRASAAAHPMGARQTSATAEQGAPRSREFGNAAERVQINGDSRSGGGDYARSSPSIGGALGALRRNFTKSLAFAVPAR